MITDEQRKLLRQAKEAENLRVELTVQAIDLRCFDLLPGTWQTMAQYDDARFPPVELHGLSLGLTASDAETYTERECRDFVGFIGMLCDQARQQREMEQTEDD